ncbi:DUF4184 family protein [Streptomyces sp. A3M-1-3]|uniref:DUF4184 family protein n=1 Tax=Streptomyces sp. A3M-1-3 TaxID=2962044 RepID=UPI0020B6FEF5|nr:DUF4184 family protein [Streptomyces sp. A3M-1-3]MCP3820995.1 DUF4184 family protein [Streptomyces sp. A3M-1-3]
MPFTLSHAAAVLPGIRRNGTARGPLIASALVAGSFSPDMTYFADTAIPGAMRFGDVTHSLLGILTVDVLVTAGLAGLWLLLREPLLAVVPYRWRGRAYAFLRGQDWRDRPPFALAAWFYVSAVVGAATHVVWDSFTHLDRWGMKVFPLLGEIVAGFPMYLYFQYGGSALALVALGWFMVSGLRRQPYAQAPADVPVLDRRELWWAGGLVALCVLAGIVHRCLRWYAHLGQISTPLDIIPTACFGAGAGLALGLVLFAVGVRLLHRSRSKPPAPPAPPLPSVRSGTGSR